MKEVLGWKFIKKVTDEEDIWKNSAKYVLSKHYKGEFHLFDTLTQLNNFISQEKKDVRRK